MPHYYTIKEVAEILQTTENTVRVKIREGIIPVHPWDGPPRVPKEFIDNWERTTETFAEKRYKALLEQMERENQALKDKLRQITIISLEVER